jgi:hypothetical protein
MNNQTVMQGTASYDQARARHHQDAAAACARLLGSARDAATSAAIAERMRNHREQAQLHVIAAAQAESTPAQTA